MNKGKIQYIELNGIYPIHSFIIKQTVTIVTMITNITIVVFK